MTKIADIKPNPFRHLERYPIHREKVEALKASIKSTGFWDNIVARSTPDGDEIAYGHHRLLAAKEELGPDAEISLIIRDLDDAMMLKIMASENMQEWESAAEIDQETIRAVLEAYDAGLIELDEPTAIRNGGRTRSAPVSDRAYTAETVAEFLGWNTKKVARALQVLDAIEAGTVREADTTGLRPSGAEKLVRATESAVDVAVRRGVPEKKAKQIVRKIATDVANDVRREHVPSGAGAIGFEVQRRLDEKVPKPPKEPVAERIARNLRRDVAEFWASNVAGTSPPASRLVVARAIAANRNSLTIKGLGTSLPNEIAVALRDMAATATEIADLIQSETAVEVSR